MNYSNTEDKGGVTVCDFSLLSTSACNKLSSDGLSAYLMSGWVVTKLGGGSCCDEELSNSCGFSLAELGFSGVDVLCMGLSPLI